MRRADLVQLEDIVGGYPPREFLTELTFDPPDATSGQAGVPLLDEHYLILSTVHSAKGQEWRSVFVGKKLRIGFIGTLLGQRTILAPPKSYRRKRRLGS